MPLTPSTMPPIGMTAPDFCLPDTEGKMVALADFPSSPAILVAFICNHCPFVKHIRPALAQMARDFQARGVSVIAINSNDAKAHPDDSPAKMIEEKREAGYPFHYLIDESQEVAKAYRAACTPDFFLFDSAKKLVYRGQMDDSRPGNGKPNDGADLRAAVEAVLAGKKPAELQKPSAGCNIKWKAGNEPSYS